LNGLPNEKHIALVVFNHKDVRTLALRRALTWGR
jgi:hypothetical protein